MNKATSFDIHRPYTISEEDFNSLESSINALAMLEEMSSELNPAIGVIQADQVSAFTGLIVERLGAILISARDAYSESRGR